MSSTANRAASPTTTQGPLDKRRIPEQSFENARRAVDEHLEPLTGSDGRIEALLSLQIFTAVA